MNVNSNLNAWKIYFLAVFLDGLGIKLGLGLATVGVLFDIGLFKWDDASWKESLADNSEPPFKDFSTSVAKASILPRETFLWLYFTANSIFNSSLYLFILLISLYSRIRHRLERPTGLPNWVLIFEMGLISSIFQREGLTRTFPSISAGNFTKWNHFSNLSPADLSATNWS